MDKFQLAILENNILNDTVSYDLLAKYCNGLLENYAMQTEVGTVSTLMKKLYKIIASNQLERTKTVKHYMSVMEDLKW